MPAISRVPVIFREAGGLGLRIRALRRVPITLMARETGSSLSRMRGRLEIRVLFALSLMHVSCGVGFGLGSREA